MPQPRFVELSGTPRAMGEYFGEQCRDDIRNLYQVRMAHLERFLDIHDPGKHFSASSVLELVRRAVPAHQQFEPAIWEEFAGISRGSGLDPEELLVTNGLTDFRDLVLFEKPTTFPPARDHLGECTALLVPGDSGDGQTILGQTWDMHADAGDYLAIVHRKPMAAPETLCLTTVGCLCLIGLNSEGVGVGNTNLVPTDARLGVNYLFSITRALQCRSAQEAADAVTAAPRLSGHNFLIVDGRSAINLECTATREHRTRVQGKPFVHTNHYLAASLEGLEFRRDIANSHWRYQQMCRQVDPMEAPIDMNACWDQLAPVSQACVPAECGFDERVATVATVVLAPASKGGRLHVGVGAADSGTRQELRLVRGGRGK